MGRVYHHEIGKRHTSNMSIGMENAAGRNNRHASGGGGGGGGNASAQQSEAPPTLHVAPGEPVPPGFEGEVEKVCEIQVGGLSSKLTLLMCFNLIN